MIILRKIITTASALIMIFSGAAFSGSNCTESSIFEISASAETAALTKPKITLGDVYGDKIEFKLNNASSYKAGTTIYVYANDNLVRKFTIEQIKNNKNMVYLFGGLYYLKPSSTCRIKVKAVYKNSTSPVSAEIKAVTKACTYFSVNKGTQLYELKNGKLSASGKTASKQYVQGKLANTSGKLLAGTTYRSGSGDYVKLTQGSYSGKYVKIDGKNIFRIDESEAKRRIVSNYAASMNGGRYVWGGASFKATDCSGLTMQAYNQIGVNISHSVYVQATKGKQVSLKNMLPGDILILNNYSHVAMYIGNNKMVHAMNSRDGIKVQSTSYLKYYTVNQVRRII